MTQAKLAGPLEHLPLVPRDGVTDGRQCQPAGPCRTVPTSPRFGVRTSFAAQVFAKAQGTRTTVTRHAVPFLPYAGTDQAGPASVPHAVTCAPRE